MNILQAIRFITRSGSIFCKNGGGGRGVPPTTVILLLAAAIATAQAQTIRRLDGSRITTAEAAQFAEQTLIENHVTGAQIVILNDSKVVWSAAYGLRHQNPDLNMDRDTVTWAASITKGVFATYVMQQVQKGNIDLDIPVAKQLSKPLTDFEAYKDTATELVKDPRYHLITPRMLLAHTSGLLNLAWMQEPDKKIRIHFQPGEHYSYSGEGINLLQQLVEDQAGKTLDVIMDEAIFHPLDMQRTSEIYQKRFADNVADRFDKNEAFHAQTRRYPARAAGNMMTSADDLGRFASALLSGKLINRKSLDDMLKPQITIRTTHQFALTKDEPEGEEAKQTGLAYGLGWGLLTTTKFGPAFFKEGHGDGAQNYMVCFTRKRDCMIILTNSDNGEFAFRPLLEKLLGDTVTPWEWEGYTPSAIAAARAAGN